MGFIYALYGVCVLQLPFFHPVVAFEVGVCDPAYFSYCFKRVSGLTPLEYREKKSALLFSLDLPRKASGPEA
ncbi:hypothetical protein DBR11_29305 [Pedobacter sp. HMWF019]|uniref:AraC family transcriptional regulator n=1 Tax=Pedobacter sp. HMWF019 TaxID=2056856 RepID=UPI000D3721B7|nr:hypothetical protein DBR11_29305 [Pedobacter sp. HMWF019]